MTKYIIQTFKMALKAVMVAQIIKDYVSYGARG